MASTLKVDNINPATGSTVTVTGLTATSATLSAPTMTGGSWTGGTDLAVADGGTGSSTANGALTNLTVTRSETGATAVPALTVLKRIITPEDFGAVGDGSTDDLTPLTNFINALLTNAAIEGRMLSKTYAISGALPNINVSGIRLIGCGPDITHDVGSGNATRIKAITNTGFTMLTVAPTESTGTTDQNLAGLVIQGIHFMGNSKAAKCVIIKSIHRSIIDIAASEATTTNIELNVASDTASPGSGIDETASAQFNQIAVYSRAVTNASTIPLRLIGSATANWSLNRFTRIDIIHKDGIGVIVENADNNIWDVVRVFQAAGGSATNSIEWRGGATSPESARDERILLLSATLAGIVKGTGTYTVGAQNIVVNLDKGNSTPSLTVESGATGYDDTWRATTPTPTGSTGAFTTASSVVHTLYSADFPPKQVSINATVTITSFTGGAGVLRLPLPVTNNNTTAAVFSGYSTSAGFAVIGWVTAGSANLNIQKYDGTNLVGSNDTYILSGSMELQ